ncbi:hypothetical protein ERJ75_001260600 [Trypanosoma vivax]|nr:hypothetical protein ERJ75_001260600 [Trypanosoma vivax]
MGKAAPQQQGSAALRCGVARCASVPGTAFVKPRTEVKNWRGRRWLSSLLGNSPVAPRRHRPTSATLATDASMCGRGELVFKDSGEVWVAGGAWEREPHCISQGEGRAVSLTLSSFAEAMLKNVHICIDSTAVMNIMKKGNAHSDALVRESSLIDKAL